MHRIKRSALLMHTAAEMFELVNDIESYEEFLPWCSGAQILVAEGSHVEARVSVSKGGMSHSFTTTNEIIVDQEIRMALLDGPFHHLQGKWEFKALNESASKVSFDLEFEFSNRLIAKTFGSVFSRAAGTMMDAFCERAKEKAAKRLSQ